MTCQLRPPGVSIAEAYEQFEMESGLVRLRGAADWLLLGGADAASPNIIARVEGVLRGAIHLLPEVLHLSAGRASFEVWEGLLLRDLAEDLREAGEGVIGASEHAAMEAFDMALDGVEWSLGALDGVRRAEASERRAAGLPDRRWWRAARTSAVGTSPPRGRPMH